MISIHMLKRNVSVHHPSTSGYSHPIQMAQNRVLESQRQLDVANVLSGQVSFLAVRPLQEIKYVRIRGNNSRETAGRALNE